MLNLPLPIVFIISAVILIGASEIGLRAGQRSGFGSSANLSTIQAAILGLLALLLGFTFSVAIARFEARRDAILNEANAIGTTALRARLLPAPHGSTTIKLLGEYVQLRINSRQEISDGTSVQSAVMKSGEIHELLWQQAKAVAQKDTGIVPTGIFIQALNEMIDTHEKRLTAGLATVPVLVMLVLYAAATMASAFTGYAAGLEGRPARVPIFALAVLLCSVLLLIQDLDRPTDGFINADQQPLLDTAAAIAGIKD